MHVLPQFIHNLVPFKSQLICFCTQIQKRQPVGISAFAYAYVLIMILINAAIYTSLDAGQLFHL